ncbi:MAG: M15 family metallopeptidase [Halanaerobiaceae bacterium]
MKKKYILYILLLLVLTFNYSGVNAGDNQAENDKDIKKVINSTDYWENLILVNKTNSLEADYVPKDLVYPDIPFINTEMKSRMKMRKRAARAIEDLFAEAREEGIELMGVSAYRSFWRQNDIYFAKVVREGQEKADMFSARPGHSEHQTGLAIDLSGPGVDYTLSQKFALTKEGSWLQENADDFGFVIRYPRGKEEITGFQYEPWHLRYVGQEHARTITEYNLTLEEYLNYILVK